VLSILCLQNSADVKFFSGTTITKKMILRQPKALKYLVAGVMRVGVLACMKKGIPSLAISPLLQHSNTPKPVEIETTHDRYLLLVHRSVILGSFRAISLRQLRDSIPLLGPVLIWRLAQFFF
jgi:hypothetical protein